MRQYTVILIPDLEEGGFTATVPALPGLVTQGESRDEALQMARDAIVFHLECLTQEGERIPDDSSVLFEHVEVPTAS
jgi:antitoxin HicB